MSACKICGVQFEIAAEEHNFYEKIDVPAPKLCIDCRRIQQMCFRNERVFYQRKCDFCKKEMISCFSTNVSFPVFCNECWWNDKFDPLKYGMDFDFNRPFFEQFNELIKTTPAGNLFIASSENSIYTNLAVGNKNCYLVVASDYNEDSFYTDYSNHNRDVCDTSFVNNSELCYESVDLERCYSCLYSQNLKNCDDCYFCIDCIGCSNCIGCIGLRNANYNILNKQYTKEAFEAEKQKLMLYKYSNLQKFSNIFDKFKLTIPRKYSNNINCENCTGNHLINCKNCFNCFDMQESENCFNGVHAYKAKDCHDFYGAPSSELVYYSLAVPENYRVFFSAIIWPGSNDVYYCYLCRIAKNCFGCVSLRGNEYCILNKQYTKEEYKKLFQKIKEHMHVTGEWGEFFPLNICPWAYNESIVNDFYPKTKEEAEKIGAKWTDSLRGTFGKETIKNTDIPDDIKNMRSEEILACENCRKNYKLIKQELLFYEKMGAPVPRRCPDCRYKRRLTLRNPRKLLLHCCAKCQIEIKTTYTSDRSEKILCEKCYQAEILQ